MVYSVSWVELLKQYKSHMSTEVYALLNAYNTSFVNGSAPKITTPCIKHIPIRECGEQCINVSDVHHSRIRVMNPVEVEKVYEYAHIADWRSVRHGYVRASVFEKMHVMLCELDRLAPYFGYASGELEITLFEGLRDLETQKRIFHQKMNEILKKYPGMSEEQAYQETCTWVSPYKDNVPVHSTGAAIDIHLWSNKKHVFCAMGNFGSVSFATPTFSEDAAVTDEHKKNRLLFLIAATSAGLINYVYEFWHFSYGDRYAAYWLGNSVACYNAV